MKEIFESLIIFKKYIEDILKTGWIIREFNFTLELLLS